VVRGHPQWPGVAIGPLTGVIQVASFIGDWPGVVAYQHGENGRINLVTSSAASISSKVAQASILASRNLGFFFFPATKQI
jgi:hypothetical protein